MATATDRVFETYELLEYIIALVDSPRDIFLMQRVCSAWRSVIKRSATIQRIIFTAPEKNAVSPDQQAMPADGWITYTEALRPNQFTPQDSLACVVFSLDDHDIIDITLELLYDPQIHDPVSTYRKSYLTQPPCTMACLGAGRCGSTHRAVMVVRDECGIKIGMLEDLMHNVATNGGLEEAKRVDFWVGFSAPKTEELEDTRARCEQARTEHEA